MKFSATHFLFFKKKKEKKGPDIIDNQFEDEVFLILGRLKFIFMRAKHGIQWNLFFF